MTRVGLAADSPKRIDQKVADQNLINKVGPTVPPLAKTLEIGGTVALDIIDLCINNVMLYRKKEGRSDCTMQPRSFRGDVRMPLMERMISS
ncbi:MAG: hypothetical protein WB660_25360, partial [Candidatus Sulfotelmatobacter sp.]